MLSTTSKILGVIALTILICYIIGVISVLLDRVKADTFEKNGKYIDFTNKKVENTREYFILLDYIIQHEINCVLNTYSLLNKKYEVIHLDEDFKKIANNVFNSLEQDLITNHSLMFNSQYMLHYISNRTQILFFHTAIDFNRGITKPNTIEPKDDE